MDHITCSSNECMCKRSPRGNNKQSVFIPLPPSNTQVRYEAHKKAKPEQKLNFTKAKEGWGG